jgi:hypothetical protein
MKVILIQGAENTGKTTLCNQIDEWLQKEFINEYSSKRDRKIEKMVVIKDLSLNTDFFALYDIKQKKSINHKRIIINSLSDEVDQFYKFKDFFEEHRIEKTNVLKDTINSFFDELIKKEVNQDKKNEIYEKKKEYLDKISDMPISNVEIQKQKIEGLEYSDKIMERISQLYTQSQEPDLLITAIRPSGTDLYDKMKDVLGDLENVSLSPKTSYSYKEDAKNNLLIQLEKTPLELIKEKIRDLF